MSGFYNGADITGGFVAGVLAVIYVIIVMFSVMMGIAIYITSAIGQMKMSKKCGVENPWLAFVPVARAYNFGLLAEKYDDGRIAPKKYGRILLGLNIAVLAGGMASIIGCVIAVILSSGISQTSAASSRIGILLLVLITLAYTALAVVTAVFNYIALYRVYKMFSPANAALFLVLSIFFSIAFPIIMLVLSFKEPVLVRRDYVSGDGSH